MPTYQFECECGHGEEVWANIKDAPAIGSPLPCEACGGQMRRVLTPLLGSQNHYWERDWQGGQRMWALKDRLPKGHPDHFAHSADEAKRIMERHDLLPSPFDEALKGR